MKAMTWSNLYFTNVTLAIALMDNREGRKAAERWAVVVTQAEDGGSSRGGQVWSSSGYILKVEP